jgi:hypothetical protein
MGKYSGSAELGFNFDPVLRCNPSINLQVGAPEDSNFTQAQTAIAIAALNLGFYVSIADDGGPQAAFGRTDSTFILIFKLMV